MGALALASQTIKLAKDLRDIERDLDAAAFKAQMVELYANLAEIKMALTDAKEALHAKDGEIKKLLDEIDALKSGEICPLCQKGRLKVTKIRNHPTFGVFGHKEHTVTCQNSECSYSDTRKVVPPSN